MPVAPSSVHSSGAAPPRAVEGLPYPVVVGEGLEAALAARVAELGRPACIVVCDERVLEHARRYAAALPDAPEPLAFPLGERRKRLSTVERVLDRLAAAGADRRTLVVGVGGGVAGDLFGFAASAYMRGVGFLNVATSVVAMVDAAIGGKTGVDLAAGKNLAGAFRDPLGVYAAVETLATLPARELREGLGEVVKHAVIAGESVFADLEARAAAAPPRAWPWAEVVAASMRIKAEVVADDRLEAGRRELLNLGHTFAHGIEHATGYRVSHGAAVAIGLRGAGLLARRRRGFPAADHARTLALLERLGLPTHRANLDVDAALRAMATDKKARAGELRFVLPRAVGDVAFGVPAPVDEVVAVLTALTAPPPPDERRPDA